MQSTPSLSGDVSAFTDEVLRALARIHAEKLARHHKSATKKSGATGTLQAGAVTFVQRFGSSLNVHVHLHTCALDGVYVEDDGLKRRLRTLVLNAHGEVLRAVRRLRASTQVRKLAACTDAVSSAEDTSHATNAGATDMTDATDTENRRRWWEDIIIFL